MAERQAPAGGELPVLPLDVVDDRRAGPAQQGRNDEADALARPGRREGHDMLGAVMTQILALEPAEKDAGIAVKAGTLDLARACPARRAIGGDIERLPCAPQRSADGGARKNTRLNSRH